MDGAIGFCAGWAIGLIDGAIGWMGRSLLLIGYPSFQISQTGKIQQGFTQIF